MQDQHTPAHGLPDWHWHVFLQADAERPGMYQLHDSGNWQQDTALNLAYDLGNQMMAPGWPEWRIVIFPTDCVGHEAALLWGRGEHEEWRAAADDTRNTTLVPAVTVADPSSAWQGTEVLYTLTDEGMVETDRAAMPEADRPPAGTPASADLALLLNLVEKVMGDDGHVDRDAVLSETARMLSKAIVTAVYRENPADPDDFWFNDPETVDIVAMTASTFVASYVAARHSR